MHGVTLRELYDTEDDGFIAFVAEVVGLASDKWREIQEKRNAR